MMADVFADRPPCDEGAITRDEMQPSPPNGRTMRFTTFDAMPSHRFAGEAVSLPAAFTRAMQARRTP